jgi:hypothetical protein
MLFTLSPTTPTPQVALAVAELAGVGEKSQYGIRLFLDTISINYGFQMQSKEH